MDRAIKHSEEFLERVAIIEFCGNVSREEAERLAFAKQPKERQFKSIQPCQEAAQDQIPAPSQRKSRS